MGTAFYLCPITILELTASLHLLYTATFGIELEIVSSNCFVFNAE